MSLKVAVVDRAHTLFQGEAHQVVVPSVNGDLGILPGHQPLLVVLRPGKVRVTSNGKTQELAVTSGFASVDNNAVTVVLGSDLSESDNGSGTPRDTLSAPPNASGE